MASCIVAVISFCLAIWACCLAVCFRCNISSSVSNCSSGKKNCCSSSATSVDCMLICMGVVRISSRIVSFIFSLGVTSSLERKSAAVLSVPATCMILKLNCKTQSHAFQRVGGIALVWKNFVTDWLSVMTRVGKAASHSI